MYAPEGLEWLVLWKPAFVIGVTLAALGLMLLFDHWRKGR